MKKIERSRVYQRLLLATMLLCAIMQASYAEGKLYYINTSFENASPLYWEVEEDQTVQIYLLYDQERDSPNRSNSHWYFQVQAEPGSKLKLVLNNFHTVYNGRQGSPLSDETICKISTDGLNWKTIETSVTNDNRLQIDIQMETDSLYIARIDPYTTQDLQYLLDKIQTHSQVKIIPIGHTIQGRPLEIIRIGSVEAPHRVFIRARAHSWESGGNWIVQGLINSLLREEPENGKYAACYTVYIMPMANKDGVIHGKSRLNMMGKDLNRNWDRLADPDLAPENAALENWLLQMIQANKKPELAIDLHNDQSGKIHVSRPEIDLEDYLKQVEKYERLMYEHTWFTRGTTGPRFRNPGTIGEGLLERYGIVAFIQEFNVNWIEGLNDFPNSEHWEQLGQQYREVFYHYFDCN